MRVAYVLSVYNRIDDLLAHLDIFKFCPFPHEIIITYLKPDIEQKYLDAFGKYHAVPVNGISFFLGPLLSWIAGIRVAAELNIDYLCYRNADDWLFNWTFEQKNFRRMDAENYLCCGYNWLTYGTHDEFAMNELYVHVPSFIPLIDEAEKHFRTASSTLCEFKSAQYIEKSIGGWKKFYRLTGREREPGIGYDRQSVLQYYQVVKKPVPEGLFDTYEYNNRWFNREWQLITAHSNALRYKLWKQLRPLVSYADQLEQEPEFARWLHCSESELQWNLPNSEDHIEQRLMRPKAKITPRPKLKLRNNV